MTGGTRACLGLGKTFLAVQEKVAGGAEEYEERGLEERF